ncbi:hypothetical protein PLESTM_001410700 [Pleodorina starrii]|nr:hypothetical protein PLESTM_001410700 [Pleodorina starrii]
MAHKNFQGTSPLASSRGWRCVQPALPQFAARRLGRATAETLTTHPTGSPAASLFPCCASSFGLPRFPGASNSAHGKRAALNEGGLGARQRRTSVCNHSSLRSSSCSSNGTGHPKPSAPATTHAGRRLQAGAQRAGLQARRQPDRTGQGFRPSEAATPVPEEQRAESSGSGSSSGNGSSSSSGGSPRSSSSAGTPRSGQRSGARRPGDPPVVTAAAAAAAAVAAEVEATAASEVTAVTAVAIAAAPGHRHRHRHHHGDTHVGGGGSNRGSHRTDWGDVVTAGSVDTSLGTSPGASFGHDSRRSSHRPDADGSGGGRGGGRGWSGQGRRGGGGGGGGGAAASRTAAAEPRRINQAIVAAGSRRRPEEILRVVEQYGGQFNHVNVATALHRLGSCGLQPGSLELRQLLADPRVGKLLRLAEQHMSSFAGHEAVNCLWALAKLGYHHHHQHRPGGGEQQADVHGGSGGENGGDNGRGCSGGDVLLEGLSAQVAASLQDDFSSEAVAKSLWALGRLGHHPGESLLRGLVGRLLAVLPAARPQEVSNCLLGLAKLGWSPGADCLDRVTRGSVAKIREFKPQELSNTLWSLAKLNHRDEQLQQEIFQQALEQLPGFNSQNIANLVWASATMGLRLEGTGGGGGGGGGEGGGEDGVNKQQQQPQQPQRGLLPEPLLRKCCEQATAMLHTFSHQELSNLLWAVAKLGYVHQPLLAAAAASAAGQLEAEGGEGGRPRHRHRLWSSQAVSNIIWAYATLGVQPGAEFLGQVCRHVSCCAPSYRWQELANTAWALATLGHRDAAALAAVEREVVARMREAEAAGVEAGEGTAAGGQHGRRRPQPVPSSPAPSPAAEELRTQHISNLLWAYATLQHPAPAAFNTLLPLLQRRLPDCSEQEISNSLWAAARAGVYDGALMDVVAGHLCAHRLPYLKPQELANVAWSYSQLRHAHRPLFDGLVEQAVSYMSYGSCSTRSVPSGNSSRHRSGAAAGGGGGGTSLKMQELASLCAATGTFGWRYPVLVQAVQRLLGALCQQYTGTGSHRMKGDEWSSLAQQQPSPAAAAASSDPGSREWEPEAGQQQQQLAAAAASQQQQQQQQQRVKARDLCTLAWGLSLVGGCGPVVWGRLVGLLGAVLEEQGGGELLLGGGIADEELAQLYQAYLHAQLDHPPALLAAGPPGLLLEGEQAWRWISVQGAQVSSFQREVSEALDGLGLSHTVELLTDDGNFSIDLAVMGELEVVVEAETETETEAEAEARGQLPAGAAEQSRATSSSGKRTTTTAQQLIRLAVEADGPWHFTSNSRQPLGTTLCRRRCLEARGWVVVSVPYWRWYDIPPGDLQGREALLAELMRGAGLGEVLEAAAAAGEEQEARNQHVATGVMPQQKVPVRRLRRGDTARLRDPPNAVLSCVVSPAADHRGDPQQQQHHHQHHHHHHHHNHNQTYSADVSDVGSSGGYPPLWTTFGVPTHADGESHLDGAATAAGITLATTTATTATTTTADIVSDDVDVLRSETNAAASTSSSGTVGASGCSSRRGLLARERRRPRSQGRRQSQTQQAERPAGHVGHVGHRAGRGNDRLAVDGDTVAGGAAGTHLNGTPPGSAFAFAPERGPATADGVASRDAAEDSSPARNGSRSRRRRRRRRTTESGSGEGDGGGGGGAERSLSLSTPERLSQAQGRISSSSSSSSRGQRPAAHGEGQEGGSRRALSAGGGRGEVAGERGGPGGIASTGGDDASSLPPWVEALHTNRALIEAGSERSYQKILRIVELQGGRFDHVNVATALHRLGSCGLQPGGREAERLLADPRVGQLLRLAGQHLPSLTGREVANCLWALAKLGYQQQQPAAGEAAPAPAPATRQQQPHQGDDAVDCITRISSRSEVDSAGSSGSPDASSSSRSPGGSSSSSGGGGGGGATLLGALCSRLGATVAVLRSQEVANSIWALGTLGHHPGESLLRGLVGRLLAVLSEARPQELSNCLLGLAKLGWSPGADCLDRLTRGSVPKIREFKPQELSNTLWSLAKLNHRDEQMQQEIFQQARWRVRQFTPQELSSLLLAAATLGLGPHGGSGGSGGGGSGGVRGRGLMPEALLRKCCEQAAGTISAYGHQELSNLLWAVAKLGYVHQPLLAAAAATAARQLEAEEGREGGRGVDISGSGGGGNTSSSTRSTSSVGSRAIGSSSSSSGGGGGSGGRGYPGGRWTGQSISTVLWAFASLGVAPGAECLQQACRHLSSLELLSQLDLQGLANTAWALASLEHRDTCLLAAVEREVVARMREAEAAGVEAGAAASDGAEGRREEEGEEGTRRSSSGRPPLRPQPLADLLWAYASLDHPAPDLFASLLPLLERRLPLGQFSNAQLAACVWAAAAAGVYDSRLMDLVAEHVCEHRLPYLRPRELASLAWGFGELGHAHRRLFDGLVSYTVSYVWPVDDASALTLSDLAAVCAAAGVFGWRYQLLLDAVERRLSGMGAGRPVGGTSAAPAPAAGRARFAAPAAAAGGNISGNPAAPVAAAAVPGRSAAKAPASASSYYSARDLCTLAWGLSLVGGCGPVVWGRLVGLLGAVLEEQGGGDLLLGGGIADEELAQLYQAYLHVRLDHPTAVLAFGPPGLLHRGAEALRRRCTRQQQQQQQQQQAGGPSQSSPCSSFQREVSEALIRLGLRHETQRLTDDGLFLLGVVSEVEVEVPAAKGQEARQRGRRGGGGGRRSSSPTSIPIPTTTTTTPQQQHQFLRIAVEADGPWHFTSNSRQPLGTTLCRRRCLEARGWVVVSVPYWRWYDIPPGDLQGREALLAELMRGAGLGQVLEAAAAVKGSFKRA